MKTYITNKVTTRAKQLLPLCLFGLLPLATGCSDFLDIKSQSEIVLEDFWNEKADVDNIVAGCYSRMQGDDVIRRMIIWGECRSDNVMAGSGIDKDGNLENILKENITTKNAYTTWDGFYSVINRCNTVIKYAPGVAAHDPGYTQSELLATIAEVSALRDLCYFYLIRTFRNVPYSTVAFTDDDQMMALPPTPFYEVLDSLINDLEKVQGNAIRRYPQTSPLYQTGRITKAAIWAMLCEMYLWKQDYDNCIKYADLVIEEKKDYVRYLRGQGVTSSMSNNDSRFNGFPLISESKSGNRYGNAFSSIFVQGNSQESIFELVFDDEAAGESMLGNSAVGLFYGNSTVTRGYIAPSENNITSENVYDDKNKKLDARIYENCDNLDAICKYVCTGVDINASSSTPEAKYETRYGYAKINNVDHYYNSSNWIIYRITDIMLLKAEALCQKMREGSDTETVEYNKPYLNEAFTLVNAVNKRAICQAILADTLLPGSYGTKSLMEELVLNERQRELMFEGKRWYDLVRRTMRDGNTTAISQIVGKRDGVNSSYVRNFFSSPATGMYAIFWPYNDEETKVNPNLASAQNPAFSSGESNITK